MSSFHFCLSAAKNLTSFQLLPASLMTDLLQPFLGLPLFLLPWGFHSRAAFDISPSSFLNVRPIHLNFLFLISRFISSWSVTLHKSLLEIMFGHHILKMYLRHRLTKDLYLTSNFTCDKPCFASIQKYWFHTGIENLNLSIFSYRCRQPRFSQFGEWSSSLLYSHINIRTGSAIFSHHTTQITKIYFKI